MRRDALLHIKHVHRLVLLLQQVGQLALQGAHHGQQVGARQAGFDPLLNGDQTDGLGAKNVSAVEFLAFKRLRSQPHRVELMADLFGDRERHAGGGDLVFHHIVAEQLEMTAAHLGAACGADVRRQRFTQASVRACNPVGVVLLVQLPGIAPRMHFALRAGLGHQLGQKVQDGLVHLRQSCADSFHKFLTRLASQATLRNGRRRCRHTLMVVGQTVAPALGSFGSSSSFLTVLIRSSRFTPSHMAMAAATNTDE